jgi:hypothetical protein
MLTKPRFDRIARKSGRRLIGAFGGISQTPIRGFRQRKMKVPGGGGHAMNDAMESWQTLGDGHAALELGTVPRAMAQDVAQVPTSRAARLRIGGVPTSFG